MAKSDLSKALRIVASALDTLEPHELEAILSGKGKLVFAAQEKVVIPSVSPPPEIDAVIARLSACRDRMEARSILEEITNKDQLTSLAKTMKIHVVKNDRREDIESKIVEFAIGGRLRSEAIQTLNLKGGGGSSGA